MKTETPVRMKTARPVSLCSLWAAVQVSRVPWGPLGARSPCLPSRPPGSLIFSALMARGTGGIPGETQAAPKLGQLASVGTSLSPGSAATVRGSLGAGSGLTAYLMPRNSGCSPGAEVALSFLRLSMCAREMTVAETYQGRPVAEVTTIRRETQRRSR